MPDQNQQQNPQNQWIQQDQNTNENFDMFGWDYDVFENPDVLQIEDWWKDFESIPEVDDFDDDIWVDYRNENNFDDNENTTNVPNEAPVNDTNDLWDSDFSDENNVQTNTDWDNISVYDEPDNPNDYVSPDDNDDIEDLDKNDDIKDNISSTNDDFDPTSTIQDTIDDDNGQNGNFDISDLNDIDEYDTDSIEDLDDLEPINWDEIWDNDLNTQIPEQTNSKENDIPTDDVYDLDDNEDIFDDEINNDEWTSNNEKLEWEIENGNEEIENKNDMNEDIANEDIINENIPNEDLADEDTVNENIDDDIDEDVDVDNKQSEEKQESYEVDSTKSNVQNKFFELQFETKKIFELVNKDFSKWFDLLWANDDRQKMIYKLFIQDDWLEIKKTTTDKTNETNTEHYLSFNLQDDSLNIYIDHELLYKESDIQNDDGKIRQIIEKINKFIFLVTEEYKKISKDKKAKEKDNIKKAAFRDF